MWPAAFDDLCATVAACRRCPRMEGRRRVLSRLNGPVAAPGDGLAALGGERFRPVLFVAEAPGRFGGDRTGIPLSTDQTGRNFSELLAGIGLRRDAIFITNAILCNPRDPAGRNARPSAREVRNCGDWLRAQIEIVDPRYVVSLGAVALGALERAAPHGLRLRDAVATAHPWGGRILVPLYHPGAQARLTRSAEQQARDWQALRAILGDRRNGRRRGDSARPGCD